MTSCDKYLLWDFDGTLAHRPGQWTDTVMAVLRAADLAHGVDRADHSTVHERRISWHEPDVIRTANQAADGCVRVARASRVLARPRHRAS